MSFPESTTRTGRYVCWLPETYFDLMGIMNYTHHGHKKAKSSMIAESYIFKVPLYFDHYGKHITLLDCL